MQKLKITGKRYHCWKDNNYLGIGTWVEDINVGDSFLRQILNDTGELVNQVLSPNYWDFAGNENEYKL